MRKISVNGRNGLTTSVIPHRNGTYPVWFEDSDNIEFIKSEFVVFE